MKITSIIFLSLFFITCQSPKDPIVSYVESPYISISNSTIDQLTKQDLFDKLYEIYQIRKETIEEQIRASLLSTQKIESYRPIDSLIAKYDIKINLKEPTSPYISIEDKYIQWTENPNSATNIIELVNPECDLCRIVFKRTNKLFETLENKTKIGYVVYSNENTLSAQALLYASYKNKFTELLKDFMSTSSLIDTTTILNKMVKHNLDTTEFNKNISILQEKCLNQNIYLRQQGISKTPTILVNHKLIYNPLDTLHIKRKLFHRE